MRIYNGTGRDDYATADSGENGFIDKVYVGDMGSQLWRVGRFTEYSGTVLTFPDTDENINNWTAQILLSADGANQRKFFYPPSITYEKGFDLVFAGTGDREEACTKTTYADRIYAIKDQHGFTTFDETDLVDVTSESATTPVLSNDSGDVDNNGITDNGWYIRLVDASGNPAGEKVLAGNTVFHKTTYTSTFTPNNDPCTPGGDGRMYALNYLTGASVLRFGNDNDGDGLEDKEREISLGGGIPSKPVMVLTELGQKLFFSVGSTSPDANSESTEAGIFSVDPSAPPTIFFYLWWQQLFN